MLKWMREDDRAECNCGKTEAGTPVVIQPEQFFRALFTGLLTGMQPEDSERQLRDYER